MCETKNIFGTDGVRGLANSGYITPENVMKLAIATVNYFRKNKNEFVVVIGKDPRLSGYMLEPALTAGFIAAGADVRLLGPIPTPAVAVLTKTLRADLGVMISASHNQYEDNGIKFFSSAGFKITTDDEEAISNLFFKNIELANSSNMGRAKRIDDINGRYIEFVKGSFVKSLTLSGIKIVVDTANGASYKVAPEVFWELGADVTTIGNTPNGTNINNRCGTTNTSLLQKTVKEVGAYIGFAFDGDADRIVVVDNNGEIMDGDYIIAVIATDWKRRDKLNNDKIVATSMSNMALERYLNSIDLELVRSEVGDKHVVSKMLSVGSNLGGEKSGHIIPLDFSTTGDGMIASLQVLNYVVANNIKSSDIKRLYTPYPQLFKNIKGDDSYTIRSTIDSIRNDVISNNGRIIVRKSGTENVIRIMIESENEYNVKKISTAIDEFILTNGYQYLCDNY
jgi:phosphoglucosamine mutase